MCQLPNKNFQFSTLDLQLFLTVNCRELLGCDPATAQCIFVYVSSAFTIVEETASGREKVYLDKSEIPFTSDFTRARGRNRLADSRYYTCLLCSLVIAATAARDTTVRCTVIYPLRIRAEQLTRSTRNENERDRFCKRYVVENK